MWERTSQLTSATLAFTLVFCTVAPVFVFAEGSVSISTVAQSSVATGGRDGHAGQDGAPGEPGADGTDGLPGQAGISISNHASFDQAIVVDVISATSATSKIKYQVAASDQTVSAPSEASATTAIDMPPAERVIAPAQSEVPDPVRSRLVELLSKLQLIIITYVSNLF